MMAALARNSQQLQPSAPGPGNQADAMNKLLQALATIQAVQTSLPPGTPLHKDVVDAVRKLSRHLPQGAPTAGVQQTGLKDALKQVMQGSFLPMILQQLTGGKGGQGGADGSAGPQPSMAPMPSMPLPGA